jgi:hypothetical protein
MWVTGITIDTGIRGTRTAFGRGSVVGFRGRSFAFTRGRAIAKKSVRGIAGTTETTSRAGAITAQWSGKGSSGGNPAQCRRLLSDAAAEHGVAADSPPSHSLGPLASLARLAAERPTVRRRREARC